MSKKLGVGAALIALLVGGVVWKQCGGSDSKKPGAISAKAKKNKKTTTRGKRKDVRKLPRASVAGTVTAKGGGPIQGARVCAWASGSELSPEDRAEPKCVESGADGSYLIKNLLASKYWLGAAAAKFLPVRYQKDKTKKLRRWNDNDLKLSPGERLDDIDFALKPGGVRVSGVVKDIGGGPVSDAFVYSGGGVVRSDASGKFVLWMKRGSGWVSGSAEGYASSWERIVAPTETVELLLTPESILEGKVVLATTGEPVVGAKVSAERSKGVHTDSKGNFRIARLDPGRYKPTANSDGLYGESAESVMLGIGETRSGVVIKLHPMGIVRGRVIIDGGSKPCPEARVSLRGSMDRGWGGLYGKAVADDQLEFIGLAKGTYKVSVMCSGYAPKKKYPDVKVTGKDMTDLVWKVVAGGSVSGVVKTADGKPAASVDVSVRAKKRLSFRWNPNTRGTTDDAGKFALKGLNPGKYDLSVRSSKHVAPKEKVAVEIKSGEDKQVEVTLLQAGKVKGIVVNKKGEPQGGYTVWVSESRWGASSATSAADGTFELEGVKPGKQEIAAKKGRRTFSFSDDKPPSKSATVVAGETVDVRIVVEASDGAISGTVVDPSGKPVSDAFVRAVLDTGKKGYGSATSQARRRWGGSPVAAQADGTFEIKNLAKGKYLVRAYRKGGGEAFKKNVELGAEVTLTIEKTVTLSGSVATQSGDSVERFKITVADEKSEFKRDESFFATEGKWKISDLPAGNYTVSVTATEGEASQKVKAAAGDSKDKIDFELTGLAKVEGYARVIGTNDPAKELRVFAMPVGGNTQDAMRRSFMQRVSTDEKGFFKLNSIAPGKVMLMLWSMGGDYYGGSVLVEAVAGQTVTATVPVVPAYVKKGDDKGSLGFTVDTPPRSMMRAVKPFDVIVKAVGPGGAAEAAGLKKGDHITAIDGVDVTKYNGNRWTFFNRGVKKGQTVAYTLKRGPTVKVTAR